MKVIHYRDLRDKDRTRFGRVHPGRVAEGQHADVIVGVSIRLHGVDPSKYEPRPHDITFRVGDTAVHGSYNLIYTGTIVAIGKATVTIEEEVGSSQRQRHRLNLFDFNFRNHDFNRAEIARHNDDTLRCI
jgi:hypothetical protein